MFPSCSTGLKTMPFSWVTSGPADGDPLAGTVRMGHEAAFVDALRDEAADGGMHASGFAEKEAVVRRHDGMEDRHIGCTRFGVLERVLQHGQSCVAWMRALDRVLELHLIPEQDEIPRAARHRNRVGQRDLPGFIDEEIIERPFPLGPAEEPGGASDDACLR